MTIVLNSSTGITTPPVSVQGATSGTITFAAPDVAGTNTQTLVAATGTLAPLLAGTAVASTSGTSIDFTSIPSWVKRITVMFSGLSTNGIAHYLIQIGAGAIVSSGYLGAGTRANGGAASTVTSNIGNAGFLVQNLSGATNVIQGAVTLSLLNSATGLWVASGCYGNSDVVATSYTGGSVTLSGVLDRVRITTAGGTDTFDAGSINIMYE